MKNKRFKEIALIKWLGRYTEYIFTDRDVKILFDEFDRIDKKVKE